MKIDDTNNEKDRVIKALIKKIVRLSKENEELKKQVGELQIIMDKNGWMSCKLDGMPKEDGEYLVTCSIDNGKHRWTDALGFSNNLYTVDTWNFHNKMGISGFYNNDTDYGYCDYTDIVIAWMPNVEPYEGE